MGGRQMKIQSRYLPQQMQPYRNSQVPSQEYKLKNWCADIGIPVAGQRQMLAGGVGLGVPGCGSVSQMSLPPYVRPHGEYKEDQHRFQHFGVAQTQHRFDSVVECRQVLLDDNFPSNKLADCGTETHMNS